jgi:hypothetical protein
MSVCLVSQHHQLCCKVTYVPLQESDLIQNKMVTGVTEGLHLFIPVISCLAQHHFAPRRLHGRTERAI